MKKAVVKGSGEAELIGFDPGYLWKKVSYFNGPKNAGRYLVITKDGSIREMMNTGTHSSMKEARILFEWAAGCDHGDTAYINNQVMTDSNLMELYRSPWGIWYEFEEWHEYEDWGSNIRVHTMESKMYPLYFLDLNLNERIELDERGAIAIADGVQEYKIDFNGEYVKEEEN